MDLTPRQRRIYELRHSTNPLMPFDEIAAQMGIGDQTARTHYRRARVKLETTAHPIGQQHLEERFEYRDPEKAAEGIDELTNPLHPGVSVVARNCGLPRDTANGLNNRLLRDYQPVYEKVGRLKSDVFIKALERNAIAALEAITPEKYERMNAYQLTLMAAISLDKKLLIEGKPTQNISLTVEDRRSVTELIAEIHSIAERRGYMKEVNPETNRVCLGDREDAPIETLLHVSSKKWMPRIDPEDES